MSERLGASKEPQRPAEPEAGLLGFVTNPTTKRLFEHLAPFACTVTITRGAHYFKNGEYLAEIDGPNTTEEKRQELSNIYKGMGVATALLPLSALPYLRRSFRRDMSRREFLAKSGSVLVGFVGTLVANLK